MYLGYRAVDFDRQWLKWWQGSLPTTIDFIVGEKLIFGGWLKGNTIGSLSFNFVT
jgi:hypothetical protein